MPHAATSMDRIHGGSPGLDGQALWYGHALPTLTHPSTEVAATMVRPRKRNVSLETGQGKTTRTKRYRVNPSGKVTRPKGEKSRPFNAKYPGACGACRLVWEPGERIQRCGQFYYHVSCVK